MTDGWGGLMGLPQGGRTERSMLSLIVFSVVVTVAVRRWRVNDQRLALQPGPGLSCTFSRLKNAGKDMSGRLNVRPCSRPCM